MGIVLQRCFAIAFAIFLGGCASGPPAQSIRATDDSVFQQVVRASISLSENQARPAQPQDGHAVEFGYSRGKGTATQTFSSGYASLGGRTYNAPTTLSYDFDARHIDVTYRYRHFLADGPSLGFELLAGLAFSELDFTAESAGVRANESMSSAGPQLGLGALWRLRPGTTLQARATGFYSADDVGVTSAYRFDFFLSQVLLSNVAIRAGYSFWRLESDRGDVISPINVDFRGPVLGLEVMF